MKAVVDRIVQYANRYQLTDVETGEVLGTFDFDEVTGTVQQVGTEIDKELFDSISDDLAARVKLSGGELAETIVTFSDISDTAENVASGDTSATLWGKVKNWFSRLKALAFKNKVAAGDFEAGAIKNADVAADAAIAQSKVSGLMTDYVASISVSGRTVTYKNKNGVNMGSITTQDTTYGLASQSNNGLMSSTDKTKLDGIESGAQKNTVLGVKGNSESAYRTGNVNITKENIGLGNVDNVKQYSASNPPPYPVTSVAGKTGAVTLAKNDVGLGNVDNTSDEDKPVSTAMQTALNGKANTSGSYPNLTVGNATNATNIIPDENGAVNPNGRRSGTVGANSTAFGNSAIASGRGSTALGSQASAAGDGSIALGDRASAAGVASTVLGRNASASGYASTALGSQASAAGQHSIALGDFTSATVNFSTALGYDASAEGLNSTALGDRASAAGQYSTALGSGTTAGVEGSTALGYGATASNGSSTALGSDATASGYASTALGYSAKAVGDYSTALGESALVPSAAVNTMQLGSAELSALHCPVNLTVTSDERDKADISDITNALAFLEKLNPVTFVSNDRENYISEEDKQSENYRKYGMCDYDRVSHALGAKKGERRRCGLLAQEVIAAMKEVYGTDNYANIVNDNFHDLQEKPSDVENKYTLAYANLVPFLIGAIKELNAKIKILEDKLNDNN